MVQNHIILMPEEGQVDKRHKQTMGRGEPPALADASSYCGKVHRLQKQAFFWIVVT